MPSQDSEAPSTDLPGDLPEEVFLDTSIFCAELKHEKLSERIQSTRERFRFVGTSSHVLLEYGNVILKEVKYFHNRLQSGMTLEDLQYRIVHQLPERFHGNKVKWFFALLLKHFNHPEAEERAMLEMERMLIDGTYGIRRRVDDVRDELSCPWIEQTGDWKTPSRCGQRTDKCRIAEFFRENETLFDRLRAACEDAVASGQDETKQLKRFADLIGKAREDASVLEDYKACHDMGDALVAVQSRRYRCMFTQNFHDSRVLCEVLEQLLLELRQEPDEPVHARDYRGAGSAQ